MVRTKVIGLLVLVMCGMCSRVKPQSQQFLFSSFFAEKNLSSLSINCLFQDSHGHMWIGTEDGLNYFNGKTIRVFKHDYQDASSLPDNVILSISEDKSGYLWIGTGRGIARLDPALFTFRNYYTDHEGNGLCYKQSVYIDREDRIWSTGQNCMYRLNAGADRFERQKFAARSGLRDNVLPRLFKSIFEDSQKRYWVSASDQLYRYFPDEGRFEAFPIPKKMLFSPVKEDRFGNLYCGTWDDGFYLINTKANKLDTVQPIGLSDAYVTQVLNGDTLLWYGNKLSTYNLHTHQTMHYAHEDNKAFSAKHSDVSCLLVDAQNQLWIGYAAGIQILSPSNQIFTTYSIAQKENDFPSVNCFFKSEKYNYAGGWHKNSLARLDKNNHVLQVWKTLLPGAYEACNNISDAWADKKGNIWFAGWPGLICFNEASGKATAYKMDTTLSKRSNFLKIVPEGDSVLWVAGYFCGLSRFSLNTKTFRNWGAHERALYWAIARDKQGMLWLADNAGVLTGFDPRSETFIQKHYEQLTEGAIYKCILYDSIANALWIGNANGLLRVDRNTFEARLFTEKDNLSTNQVNALQFDPSHRLWIATNKGLCFYEPKQNLCRTFFSNNGLPGNVLSQVFSMQPGGELYIGYPDGFSVLKTNDIRFSDFSQSVSIDRVYESGRIIPMQKQENRKTVELNYDQDNIKVEFSSNDLINSEDNQLMFKLDGVDNEWRVTPDGNIQYNKLAPGRYVLQASSVNHTGRSKPGDSLLIIIHPPFWRTTWFITLVTLCLLGILLFVARYVFTRNLREKILILEKEQAIEKERSRISQDMHDELGSGLTKISIMSEVAMMQISDPQRAKQQLENISMSSRGLVDNLQDIIWILNSKYDSLENLCAYIQEYALKYFETFDIQVKTHFPEKLPVVRLSEDQRRNTLLVFKESFNNIIKHSHCSEVSIAMQESEGAVVFCISDNGKGFDKTGIRHFANGLHNMEKRMEVIRGHYSISSVLREGTRSEFGFQV